MTTYVAFAPTPAEPFSFRPTLDGQEYTAVITWSLFGQRWYLNLYTLQGALVVSTAMVESPDETDFDLVAVYFTTSTLVFRGSTQQFEVTP